MNDQDSGTIIITSLLLLPWLGRVAVSGRRRYGENTSKCKPGKQNKTSEVNFPSNLATAFTTSVNEISKFCNVRLQNP